MVAEVTKVGSLVVGQIGLLVGGKGRRQGCPRECHVDLKPPAILRSPGGAEEAGAKASLQGTRSLGGRVSRVERKEPGAATFLSSSLKS